MQLPALGLEHRHIIMNGGAPVEDFGPLPGQPLRQVLHPPKGRDLAQLVGADGDGVEEFLRLGQQSGLT